MIKESKLIYMPSTLLLLKPEVAEDLIKSGVTKYTEKGMPYLLIIEK